MSGIFFVPVDDSWLEEFSSTVSEPVPIDPEKAPEALQSYEEVRIWGTPETKKKRARFNDMENGDPVLFYNSGTYFATGRVGEVYDSPEIAEYIWGEKGGRLIFTINDFQEISVDPTEVNRMLGYKESYIPMGFSRPSEEAISNLLQSFNSIEEAYQSIRVSEEDESSSKKKKETSKDELSEDNRTHTEIQALIIELGHKHGYDVYVAKNDQSRIYEGEELGSECIDNLNLTGFSKSALNIIEYVDVIWLKDDYIVQMFEIESTTSIYSGILRMTDFVVKVPNLAVEMNIVASRDDEKRVRREMNRPTFKQIMEKSTHNSLNYISFEEVREKMEIVNDAGPLQCVF
jgi:hypothetical protein